MKYSKLVKTKEFQELACRLMGMCGSDESFTYSCEDSSDFKIFDVKPCQVIFGSKYMSIIYDSEDGMECILISDLNLGDDLKIEKEICPDSINYNIIQNNIINGFDFLPES